MEKYDTSQLTEFPRFESETSQSSVSTFFNKFLKFPLFTPSEGGDDGKGSADEKQGSIRTEDQGKEEYEDGKPETGSYAVELEGRSLPNVLRRISSLIALGSGGGTRYADTELARYWMPDDISRECYECATRFSTLRRRHHCRVCGQIFCSRCCSQRVPGHIFGCNGGLRVCNYCCNVVLSYLKENDLNGEISPDLKTLQENLQVKFPENKERLSKSRDNFMFSHDQEERCDVRNSPKETLRDVFRQLSFALPTQQHRYRLVSYNGVWRGCDVLQWVMDNTQNKTRVQANALCQSLLRSGYMECTTESVQFCDYALYRPVAGMLRDDDDDDDDDLPEETPRLMESVSSYCLDLNLGDSSARLIKTAKTEKKSSSSEEETPVIEQTEVYKESDVCRAILSSGAEHLRLLLRQCLARAALPAAWLHTLLPLCEQSADLVQLDPLCDDIDIRHYVQVKKVPGGTPRDSCLLNGVVLTKNVAHRGMPQQITNPSILLLDCSIAYQRVEGKLTSLEPVLMQEKEYLTRCADRITALRPKVVLVGGSAGRVVQGALRRAGAALALRVPPRALRRAARCARADMLTSIDARIGMPRLGTCRNFYIKNYETKTLMVLEGCAEPHLGCCILLRGASLQELIRVKKVVKFMLLACYNWKLEKAFLGDIEAILPEPGTTFDDENEDLDPTKTDLKIKDDPDKEKSIFSNTQSMEASDIFNSKPESSNPDLVKNEDSLTTENDITIEQNSPENEGTSKKNSNIEHTITDKTDVIAIERKNVTNTENYKITSGNDDVTKTDNHDVASENNTTADIKDVITEIDDPLQRPRSYKKTDNLSCGVPIRDFSDPLRSTLSVDDDVFLPKEQPTLVADAQNERWSADDVILSMSPTVMIPAPYLETDSGRRCPLRACFPSPLLAARPPRVHRNNARQTHDSPRNSHVDNEEYHPFVSMAITGDDNKMKTSLASYRAIGSRTNYGKHKSSCPQYNPSVTGQCKPLPPADQTPEDVDPFAPENHQLLHVLLYSYSNKSPNGPDFCVNPWVAAMEMYGRHDISLGAFLEKYCFNGEYKCSSNNCHVPMNQHVRKFVHGDVCITITCNTIGHSNVDRPREERHKQVMFWSRCEQCGATSRARRLSPTALSVSLAQHLRWRVSAARNMRRPACPHALHKATHMFQCPLTAACFRYSKISTYDIVLPPDTITTNYDTKQMRDTLISQLNELMLKGHETFNVAGSDADKEYQAFKHHMESLHVALTSSALQDSDTYAVVQILWSISDGVIFGEKMLRDAQDHWSSPPAKSKPQPDTPVDDKSDIDESSGESSGKENSGTTYVFTPDANKDAEKEHTGTEEDEEKGDKKTVKQILSQLLPNNQPANQSGMILIGLVPVMVSPTQTGSVIAATLACSSYRRSLSHVRDSTQSELEESDSNCISKEKSDGDKSKTAKSNEHVEVLLKDGLVCRVYYAAQFQALRHAVIAPRGKEHDCCCDSEKKLCDIEEGFIRSLAQCVPWATRGGKSGSTFCKTKDDRYVLKEMTKPEWQQFLEFAPHYFNYVTSCRQNKVPSLLARILGVYSVGGAGSGVLVMENVWYSAAPHHTRFDLKGASRHRLASPTPRAVLMDENLLNLRWERALYVRGDLGRALGAIVSRDTQFLCTHCVMDYSLLLALGESALVLGVIDYIRTFTWDKKLEHLVKKNLGSGQPTVVSPEQYMARFIAATRKYFLPCPEPWDHLYTVLPKVAGL